MILDSVKFFNIPCSISQVKIEMEILPDNSAIIDKNTVFNILNNIVLDDHHVSF